MNRFILTVLALTVVSAQAEDIPVRRLEPILKQKPLLHRSIMNSFDLANDAYAGTKITDSHPKLGGKNIGPYIIDARVKGSKQDYALQLVVCTSKAFVDVKGIEVADFKKATAVKENFKYYLCPGKSLCSAEGSRML